MVVNNKSETPGSVVFILLAHSKPAQKPSSQWTNKLCKVSRRVRRRLLRRKTISIRISFNRQGPFFLYFSGLSHVHHLIITNGRRTIIERQLIYLWKILTLLAYTLRWSDHIFLGISVVASVSTRHLLTSR